MNSIADVSAFYKRTDLSAAQKHAAIYQVFGDHVRNTEPKLKTAFEASEGFGELPFCWNWFLAVQDAPQAFRFLEIGVYKGRTLAQVQLAANILGKQASLWGLTPLSTSGDKYSGYDDTDYFKAIQRSFSASGVSMENTQIIRGFSQDGPSLAEAAKAGPFDILYIDGCHDYEVVCADIDNYVPMLKVGGVLVMDDASLFLEAPGGRFKGHPDVGRAIQDRLDGRTDMEHLFAVGHNRVWRKVA